MMRVLIADDHTMFRQGLATMLGAMPDIVIIAQTGDGQETLDMIIRTQPDLAIVDISMPRLTGIEILREVRLREMKTRLVFLTMHTEPELAAEAIESGVSGYLLKENAFEDLVSALRRVINGDIVISPNLYATTPNIKLPPVSELSSREQEILRHIASGLGNKQIADRLRISTRTVEAHRANIMLRLNLHSTAELVRYAIRRGIAAL
jgi:two-component system response regulator NreC